MLNVEPKNLLLEVEAAESWIRRHLTWREEQIAAYHGPFYLSGKGPEAGSPVNHAYEVLSWVVPQIIFDNPRVKISSRRGSVAPIDEAMQHATNATIIDQRLRELLIDLCIDQHFNYGVAKVGIEEFQSGRPDFQLTTRPFAERLSPPDWFYDPAAYTRAQARFEGHRWAADLEDVKREAQENPTSGWRLDVLTSLAEGAGMDEYAFADRDIPDRGQVMFRDVWVPEIQLDPAKGPEQGYHGTIFTVCEGMGDEFPRDPRSYFGPPSGPYALFGNLRVPDDAVPMGSLTAEEPITRELNLQASSMCRSARRYKRIAFVNDTDEELPAKIEASEDGLVHAITGFLAEHVAEIEIGGVTQQQVAWYQFLKLLLDQLSGLSAAQRGEVTGDATATENAIADEASDVRLSFKKREFAEDTRELIEKESWFLWHTESAMVPLGAEAGKRFGYADPAFVGGPTPGMRFEDLEHEIEPYSMERSDQKTLQRQAMELFNMTLQLMEVIPTKPFVDWAKMLDVLGAAFNIPLSEVISVEQAMQYGQAMMMLQTAGAGGAPSESGPQAQGILGPPPSFAGARLSGDAGPSNENARLRGGKSQPGARPRPGTQRPAMTSAQRQGNTARAA